MAEEEDKELDLDIEEEGKPKSKLMLFIIIGVVLLLAIGAAVFFLLSGSSDEEELAEEAVEEIKQPAVYLPLRPAFIVNYVDGGRTRYLQAELSLLTRSPTAKGVVDQHDPLIRSNILSIMSSQDFEELRTVEGKQLMQQALLEHMQVFFETETGDPTIEAVLFTSLVMQ